MISEESLHVCKWFARYGFLYVYNVLCRLSIVFSNSSMRITQKRVTALHIFSIALFRVTLHRMFLPWTA